MNKPFTLAYEEFKQALADLINNSNMPFCVIESILQNYLYEVNTATKKQYKSEKAQYESLLLEQSKEGKESKEDNN